MNGTAHSDGGNGRITRRGFLRTGIAGGALLAALPETLAGKGHREAPAPPLPPPEEEGKSIEELAAGMKSGSYTAKSLTESYIMRIGEIDRRGPSLRSVIELNPDAVEIAAELDKERRTKGPRGPLHGIPLLIKDNIDTADRMATTAGSLALTGSKPPEDAFLVRQLRSAGAIILGKTNLSEWANIRSNHSTSGWSGRGDSLETPTRSTGIPQAPARAPPRGSRRTCVPPRWERRPTDQL